METRQIKALEIAGRMKVVRLGAYWLVPSQSGAGPRKVCLATPSCTCEDFVTRQLPCKHIFAAGIVRDREAGTLPPGPQPDPDAVPQAKRPTYPQDWRAYNRAQLQEKDRFQVLLADLCRHVEEPPAAKTGRPRVPMADRVFASVFKVYSTVSSRRFNCDLQDATEAGHLSRPVHCNKVNAFLETEDMTPVLRNLVTVSSLPLKAVEVDFAGDSSGFMTSRFIRWFDVKYGTERKKAEWVKVHLMCGVKTNIVTAVEIHGKDAADSPQLPALVGATAKNFTIREVSADKAYGGLANCDAIEKAGGTPFIAFKSNATGSVGGSWEQMFHYFSLRRDEFLKHYHKRSNVESTFSMMKRKFGDSLRSKTDTAMLNEALCKVLCHNIAVVIHEQEELGITADFWCEDPADTPAVLQFPGVRKV